MAHQSTAAGDQAADGDVHYTAFIRLPFPRGDFVDPPLVDWDTPKDKALWKILSRNPRSSDLDWKDLAARFEVTLPFILQQAAWLYERQLSQVREQMRKVSKDSGSGSTVGAQAMQRVTSAEKSRQSNAHVDSSLLGSAVATPRIGSTVPRELPATRQAAPMSRNPSTNTITQSRPFYPSSPGNQLPAPERTPLQQSPKRAGPTSPSNRKGQASDQALSTSSEDSDESSGSSDDRPMTTTKSQMFRRPPPRFMGGRTAKTKLPVATSDGTIENDDDIDNSNDEADVEDDEEDALAFLPMSAEPDEAQMQQQDLGATLRHPQQDEADSPGVTKIASQANTDSSVSSASSAAVVASPRDTARNQRPLPTLSPQQRAEIAKLSPRKRGTGRDGSEGTRSMGSSFSDLDDASVTQSALEEALMSNMQHGGASRISNLSQALRSRYL